MQQQPCSPTNVPDPSSPLTNFLRRVNSPLTLFLRRYANVLRSNPGSRLVFFEYKGHGQAFPRLLQEFAARGIPAHRIGSAPQQEWIAHTWRKGAFDLALDTLEKQGHTTGLDGAWAGVPV